MKNRFLSHNTLLGIVLVALFTLSLKPAAQTPPGMVSISNNKESIRYLDKEQMSFREWNLIQSLIQNKIGDSEAEFLNPDTSAIIAVYGQSLWQTLKQSQFNSDLPLVGLNLDQIYSYMNHRATLVYQNTGIQYQFDLPYIDDYMLFKPSKKPKKGVVIETNKAPKSKKIRGLFSNINDVIMGHEGYHEVLHDGSTQSVHPDSIVYKSFRAVAVLSNENR